MRVEVLENQEVRLNTLKAGDVFRYDGGIYLKTNYQDGEEVEIVGLGNGMVDTIKYDYMVFPLDGKFVVGGR